MIYNLILGYEQWEDKDSLWFDMDERRNRIQSIGIPFMVVHGGSNSGTDALVQEWASFYEIPTLSWPARLNWGGRGLAEVPFRNNELLDWLKQHSRYEAVDCYVYDHPLSRYTRDYIQFIENYDLTLTVLDPKGLVYERTAGQSDQTVRYQGRSQQSRTSN